MASEEQDLFRRAHLFHRPGPAAPLALPRVDALGGTDIGVEPLGVPLRRSSAASDSHDALRTMSSRFRVRGPWVSRADRLVANVPFR